ncbi:hypothetical protein K488DRAFT_74497 [Vararia minispora EC-137]|uniref:Uncharacterized protein n=1 Tax=Vararia minispora EC-137 TaxID=1314806 RepID=A0ACB8Q7M3_9AGAM|nr:hypothetical protein K488DRAFT_74497 [Vararia minispora EC-137]
MSSRFYIKKQKPGARASASKDGWKSTDGSLAGQSNEAAEPRHKGRPYSIKSKEHRDWLETQRPAYECASRKGKTAAREFLNETTTAFLDRFSWSYAHFKTQGIENQEEDGVQDRDSIYKLARQKVYNLYHSAAGGGRQASQPASVQWLLQSLLVKVSPLRRPKLVNVFRRSPHYTPEMCAEFAAELRAMAEDWDDDLDEDAEADEDEDADVDENDREHPDSDDDDDDGDDGDDGGDRAAPTRNRSQRLAREEQFLSRKLRDASTEVKKDLEERAVAEYERKVAQRRDWLDQGPKTFEETAEMMRTLSPLLEQLVTWLSDRGTYSAWYIAAPGDPTEGPLSMYSFLGGSSPSNEANGARVTFDLYDPGAHADACLRVYEHAVRGLCKEPLAPSAGERAPSSHASSAPAMQLADADELEQMSTTRSPSLGDDPSTQGRLALVLPEGGEDDTSGDGSDWFWPGEVPGTPNAPADQIAPDQIAPDQIAPDGDAPDDDNAPPACEPNVETELQTLWREAQFRAGTDARTTEVADGFRAAERATARSPEHSLDDGYAALEDWQEGDSDGAAGGEYENANAGEDVRLAGDLDHKGGGAPDGAGAGECERLGDAMTQEEEEYWDSVMWPDEGYISPRERWLGEVSKVWVVTRAAGARGKAPKSWIHKHAQIVAEVVRSTMGGPPGMEGLVVYPQKLMDAFDAAAALESQRGFEVRPARLENGTRLTSSVQPAARDNSSTYLEELPEHLQPDYWKAWRKARFPATLPVAAEGVLPTDYGLHLIRYWIACQPVERLPQTRSGSLEMLAAPEEGMDWSVLAARGPGGTFGFVRGLTVWAANIGALAHTRHWNALATDIRQVFLILALKGHQKATTPDTPEGASTIQGTDGARGTASGRGESGYVSALVSVSAGSVSVRAEATTRAISEGSARAQTSAGGTSAEDGKRRVRKESQKLLESKRHAEAIEAARKKRRKIGSEAVVPEVGHGGGMGVGMGARTGTGAGMGAGAGAAVGAGAELGAGADRREVSGSGVEGVGTEQGSVA